MSENTARIATELRRQAEDRARQLNRQYQADLGQIRDTQADLIADLAEQVHRLTELVEPLA